MDRNKILKSLPVLALCLSPNLINAAENLRKSSGLEETFRVCSQIKSPVVDDNELEVGRSNVDYSQSTNLNRTNGILESFSYTIEFSEPIPLSKDDLLGEDITLLGNRGVISRVNKNRLDVMLGNCKIRLGEGESTKIFDKSSNRGYDIELEEVDEDGYEVDYILNGKKRSLDLNEVRERDGFSVGLSDLVPSRKKVKGFAEFRIGARNISLVNGGEVRSNGRKISDLHEGYVVNSKFIFSGDNSNQIKGIEIKYTPSNNEFQKDLLFGYF